MSQKELSPAPTEQAADKTAIDALVANAQQALAEFENLDQRTVDIIVETAARKAREAHAVLAAEAVTETKRGNFEDKTVKNIFASEVIAQDLEGQKTVGVISRDEFSGIVEVAEPVGVVAGLTPVTNPTSTTIFKALICLKTRNPIIFAFHPFAQNCSAHAAKIVYEAALEAGAPKGCVQWITAPSMQATTELINHPGVAVILATGGNAMVKSAYSCGKPALGVGAGNCPAYIHESAVVKNAVNDVTISKSFDNGMICAAEQAVILDEAIADEALAEFESLGCYLANAEEKAKLEELLFGARAGSEECKTAKLNAAIVGQKASKIAEMAGFSVPEDTPAILVPCSEVSYDEPLTREKLSPILAVLRAKNSTEGIDLSRQMVEQDGLGHSAAIHCREWEVIDKFAKEVNAVRVIENSPSAFGAIGGLYNAMVPSLTLGCGSYGHNSVSNNISAVNLLNIKRLARRNPVMMPFQVPNQIYLGSGYIRQLANLELGTKITVITNQRAANNGQLDVVMQLLYARSNKISVQVIDDAERHFTTQYLEKKVREIAGYSPQTVIAVGERCVINAAKFLRLFAACPELSVKEVCAGHISLPAHINSPQLICVPTITGGRAAVAPSAAITDANTGFARPVKSTAFLPQIVVMDTTLAPYARKDTLRRGFQGVACAIEAYTSTQASEYTDSLALHGLENVYKTLPRVVSAAEESQELADQREKVIEGAFLISTAQGNTAMGLAGSLTKTFAAAFGGSNQEYFPAVLPNVVRFLGGRPRKFVASPNYLRFQAPQQLAEICRRLGIEAREEDAGAALAQALENLVSTFGVPLKVQDFEISEADFLEQLPELAQRTFDRESYSGTPRKATMAEIENMLKACYYGEEFVS